MSLFDGLKDAQMYERGTFMSPGIYDMRVSRMICKETQSSGLAVIVEMDVITSKPRPQDDPKGEGRTWIPTPAGIQGTWFQSMTDKNVAFPALKGFLHAALGLKAGDTRAERLDQTIPGSEHWPANPTRRPVALVSNLMEHAISEENILAGLYVHLECSMILTQKRKEDFTLYRFTPADYAALGVPPPNLDAIFARAALPIGMAVPPAPPVGWGTSNGMGPGSPPGWGAPPMLPPVGSLTVSGTGPVGAPPPLPPNATWVPPTPPPLDARSAATWTLPQGGQLSPDGRKYWAPGMATWAPVPAQDDIPF